MATSQSGANACPMFTLQIVAVSVHLHRTIAYSLKSVWHVRPVIKVIGAPCLWTRCTSLSRSMPPMASLISSAIAPAVAANAFSDWDYEGPGDIPSHSSCRFRIDLPHGLLQMTFKLATT